MKTKQTILCGLFAVIIALLTFAACDILGTESDGKGPDNVNGKDPDGTDPGDGPGDGSQTGNTHTHQWGAWEATELTGTEERVCADNPAHIEARLTGTTRFAFNPFSGAAAYSVSKGTAIIGTVRIPAYYRPSAEVEFHPVEAIGSDAFRDCASLTSIDIPETVTYIGGGAFYGCIILTDIDIPETVTSIGNEAFALCTSLTSITIPSSLTSIGDGVFYGTAWFNNQPDGLVYAGKVLYMYKGTMPANTVINNIREDTTIIVDGVFSGCTGLTSITIPAGVTYIGSSAFQGCTSLTSVTFAEGSQLEIIGGSAFRWCTSLINITIPAGVTSIGNNTFSGCTGLTNITIPASVTTIGIYYNDSGVFNGCTGLTSVTFAEGSQLETIGNRAFSGCRSLTSITIPTGVTTIGNEAFSYWTASQTIYVPWLPGNRPNGWDSQWNVYCDAQIVYQGEQ